MVRVQVYVGASGGISCLAEQKTRLIPPRVSITPLTVKVIVSPTQTTGGCTSIVPPESTPLSKHPSYSGAQHGWFTVAALGD
jgi:hypothetical protein